jgi:hypothetical protein
MKKLLDKILGGNTVLPSLSAKDCLTNHFKDAISIEWSEIENGFEAIFYINNQEYISRISKDGVLLEYKINIKTSNLPEIIQIPALEHGELMNVISIQKPNQEPVYELIIRNEKLERFAVLFNANGTFIKKVKL